MPPSTPTLGVAIVTFNSADVVLACLDSLRASTDATVRIVITDNQSQDGTVAAITGWAAAQGPDFTLAVVDADPIAAPRATLTLIRAAVNGGYAHGVNSALSFLRADPAIDLFWVLNPDCVAAPGTAAAYLAAGADQNFTLMSSRTLFHETPDQIQTDGGRVSRWTGVCHSVNAGQGTATAQPDAATLDFLTGANIVASRRFLDAAGLMVADYFLFFEEVDWAFRRGDLPPRLIAGAEVFHHGGTSIGSGSIRRRASAFANYFNHRNRIRFVRRFMPLTLPGALAFSLAKAAQLILTGGRAEGWAILAGSFGLPAPASVRDRLGPAALRIALGR
ncbi:MAG: glycosyltransferase family 2 protein [Sphingopyxis sp.]|nr:glycosyltransferase family 2 protein [Sphingopyxis sp.]